MSTNDIKKLDLSARSYLRTLKIARRIADLDQKDQVLPQHISESLQYRLTKQSGDLNL